MPLIKRPPATAAPSTADAPEQLRSADPEQRRRAARSLHDPQAIPALIATLETEREPAVREAVFSALVTIGGTAARDLLPFLRSDDAGLRNGAVEALQTMPDAVRPLLPGLLTDPDPDVRLLAAEIARALPPEDATDLLCRMLEHETHVNVCATAVDILADIGTVQAVPVLQRLGGRFAGEPFLSFAVSAALARLSETRN